MSLDPSLPIPSGRATQGVSAPTGASAPQGGVSGFDALMAALGPATDVDTQTSAGATADATAASVQADIAPVMPTSPPAAASVLPQLVEDLQTGPAGAVPAALAKAARVPAPQDATLDPTDTSAAPVAPAATIQAAQLQAATVQPAATTPPAELSAPVTASSPKAEPASHPADKAQDDRAEDDSGANAPAPVDTTAAQAAITIIVAVPVQTQAASQPPVEAQVRSAAPVLPKAAAKPDTLAAPAVNTPPQLPLASAPVADASQAAAPVKASDKTVADDAGTPAATPVAATTDAPVAAPVQVVPKPDMLAGALKTMRKALTDDAAVTDAAPAPRNSTSSGFSLQQLQAETVGSYTTTGAQAAGMTQGGSNLSRATVETLSAMAVQVSRKLSEGNTKFAVELHPADLGKVEVTLSIARDGTTTAHLKFDTPVTAAAFQAQEGELRHQLAQTGLNLDSGSLTFSSRDDGNGGGSFNQAFAQSQQQDQSQNRQSQAQARAFQTAAAAVAADADTTAAVDAGLLALRAGASSTLALNLIV